MAITDTNVPRADEGMLSPYRVLDLTEGGCNLAGKMLGDLGADVIKIEPPGGSETRRIGPFWHSQIHPERSLFWWAYNINKRGITLNIASADGAAIFRRLAESAHFVLESFPPGFMDDLGLGYEALSRINQSVIVTSIAPYGSSGPKAKNAWSDLTVWSSAGPVYLTGDMKGPPVAISFMHQAALNAGAEAAAASMIAHYYRMNTWQGQHVDVSMQEAAYWVMTSWQEFWEVEGVIPQRFGGAPKPLTEDGLRERRLVYPAKDGYVAFLVLGGGGAGSRSTRAVLKWMSEEGVAPEWLLKLDWDHEFNVTSVAPETLDAIEQYFVDFFRTKTKAQISERALWDPIMIGAMNSCEDVADHPHLKERNFFQAVWHEDLAEMVTYGGPCLRGEEAPLNLRRPAPAIGQHNQEIYQHELGLSVEEVVALRGAGVI